MPTEIVMPNLGFDSQSGRLIEWLKQPGDMVARGDVLAVIESDKANVELESVASGVLLDILVPADSEVAVGVVIARVGAPGEQPSAPAAPASPASVPPAAASHARTVEVSPIAKRMAEEHGIDLSRVTGTGRDGRIVREDVEAAMNITSQNLTPRPNNPTVGTPYRASDAETQNLTSQPPLQNGEGANGMRLILALPRVRKAAREAGIDLMDVPASGARGQITPDDLARFLAAQSAPAQAATGGPAPSTPMRDGVREIVISRARRTIGERLGKSMREAPHFYVTGEFDLEAALARLTGKARVNDLVQYLAVRALLRVPELNATYEGDKLYQHEGVHLGIAVALGDGLITPVLRHAERYSPEGIADAGRALVGRAREGRLKADELQGASFTISNLGMVQHVERFTAVINPPQVAILAVGAVKPRPVVIDGGLHIRRTMYATISGDHRAVDGMHLARYLAAFGEELERFSQ